MADFRRELEQFEKKEAEKRSKTIQRQKDEQKSIIKEFKDSSLENFFYNLDRIENKYLFQYIVILFIFIFISTRVQLTVNHVVNISIAGIIIYYLYAKRDLYDLTYYDDLRLKLRSIYPKPKYFHVHPELINYFFHIREYKTYNEKAFDAAMEAVDNIINIEYQIKNKVDRCHYIIQIAKQNMYDAINHIHSIIHTIPLSTVTLDKHKDSINVLKTLLLKIINNMINNCNANLEQDGRSVFKVQHSKIKHHEETNNNFDFY